MNGKEIKMKKAKAYFLYHEGTNYEIGKHLGQWALNNPDILEKNMIPENMFKNTEYSIEKMLDFFEQYCPGTNEEIRGFADVINIKPEKVLYYLISYFAHGCNVIGVRPEKSENGHTLLAYTYDFTDVLEEMCLATTKVKGKYMHTGCQCNIFGRANGINEHGLSMCQAANGIPVTNIDSGLDPQIEGINFWCAIRTLLESCKDINEAIARLENIPVSYNMNLIMGDATGDIVLFEGFNGDIEYKIVDRDNPDGFVSASNHAVLPGILAKEDARWRNSVIRSRLINNKMKSSEKISINSIKDLISTSYPDGLCTHYYDMENMFGMLYGGIMDINEMKINVTLGTPQQNQWREYYIGQNGEDEQYEILLPYELPPEDFYEMTEEI